MLVRVFFLSLMVLALGAVAVVVVTMPRDAPVAPVAAAIMPATSGTAVLVAAKALAPGTLLRPDDVRWQDWPLGDAPQGYVTRGRDQDGAIFGAVTRRAFVAGEPLMKGQIVLPNDRGFLAAVLTPGLRAVAVGVDAVSAASGLIWPGDRVDLVLAQTFNAETTPPGRRAVGETLLRDLRVLSIDQHLSEAKGERGKGEPVVPRTVTLEVTAKDAEKIAVASGLGRLSLVLRSLGDDPAPDETGDRISSTWAAEVSPALAVAAPVPAAAAPRIEPPGAGVLIVRGAQRSVFTGG